MNKTISLTALVSDESAVVEAQTSSYSNIGTVSATGWSKKHPNDEADNETGYNLAVARALRSLADEFEKRAEARMNSTTYVLSGYLTPAGGSTFTYTGTFDPSTFGIGE